jgi:hypothetical protein
MDVEVDPWGDCRCNAHSCIDIATRRGSGGLARGISSADPGTGDTDRTQRDGEDQHEHGQARG